MNSEELLRAYKSSITVENADIELFANFWDAYTSKDVTAIESQIPNLSTHFYLVKNAVNTYLKTIPYENQELNFYESQILHNDCRKQVCYISRSVSAVQ
ncbi:MAG: hypothetical protein ACI9V1_000826 [Spirosomataceae bacterium]|jgi:hypothetical protein